jgi:hypothetical protein
MRGVLIVAMLLLAVGGSAVAADYIRIDVDTVCENETSDWEFYLLRECPEPEYIVGCTNGWQLNAVGNATWDFSFSGYHPFEDHLSVWNLGGLLLTDFISGTGVTEGWFFVGGAAMPPDGGMPIYETEKLWFSLTLTMGDLPPGSTGDGIMIDSAMYLAAP